MPEALRPLIAKYEQQRIAFVNEKTREAAQVREEAMRVAQGAVGVVEQAAAWWQQNGPGFQQAFADRWSQVDWNKLAADNPAEWTRLKQQRDHEATLLVEANRRGQAEIAIANERAERAFFEARQVEHTKLAKKLPEYFGPDVAAKTYDDLGNFLFAKGIPADRINAIHEAPIIELALAAMRLRAGQEAGFDRHQAMVRRIPPRRRHRRASPPDRPNRDRQPAGRGCSASGRAVQEERRGLDRRGGRANPLCNAL